MGFHKRFLSKKGILLHTHHIIEYLSADALYITDDFSYQVYRLYSEGKGEEEIINYINENKNED